MIINNRSYSFSSSSYSTDEDTRDAIYKFNSPTPPYSDDVTEFDIAFTKAGSSFIRAFDIDRLVRKSTITQETRKEFSKIIGGFKVKDISFDNTHFQIQFNESEMDADSFSYLQVFSQGKPITRQLRAMDASIGTGNDFRWDGLDEFSELKKNKDYVIKMVKGASSEAERFFVLNKSGDWHYLDGVSYEGGVLGIDLQNNYTFTPLSFFNSIGIRTIRNKCSLPSAFILHSLKTRID